MDSANIWRSLRLYTAIPMPCEPSRISASSDADVETLLSPQAIAGGWRKL